MFWNLYWGTIALALSGTESGLTRIRQNTEERSSFTRTYSSEIYKSLVIYHPPKFAQALNSHQSQHSQIVKCGLITHNLTFTGRLLIITDNLTYTERLWRITCKLIDIRKSYDASLITLHIQKSYDASLKADSSVLQKR